MNLIICLTPLQMLIAEKIIDLFPNENFSLIVVALSDNEKYRYYYNKLNRKVNKSFYFHKKDNFFSFLKFIFVFRVNGYCINYKKYFFASVDSRYIHYVLSQTNSPVVYTFDDGTMNIYQDSTFYKKESLGFLKYLLWRVLGIRYFQEELKSFSRLHYSIYPNIRNIVDNVKYLELFNSSNCNYKKDGGSDIYNRGKNRKVVSFFLGQPLDSLEEQAVYESILNFIRDYGIDYYFLHPREDFITVKGKVNISVINSKLIFEDFIVDFCIEHNIHCVKLYSISSSVLFNLADVSNVSCFFLYNGFLYSKYKQIYDLSSEKFGIVGINLDEEES